MQVLKKILGKFNGLHYPQEYLCLAYESFQQPLYLYWVEGDRIKKDVTTQHAFVGYCPVIFAFPSILGLGNECRLIFSPYKLEPAKRWKNADAVASLLLHKAYPHSTVIGGITYCKAAKGRHRFTTAFHQAVAQLQNRLYNRKPGNVYLKGNLFKQVQIAYALPRKICLITVGGNGLFNLFPTDLHGQVDEMHYVISLRHAGKACEQVLRAEKLVLSDMEASAFKDVYRMGKNHMQPLKIAATFDFSLSSSQVFQLPLPKSLCSYKELELVESFMEGIHRLLLFKIINVVKTTPTPQTLVHIHSAYATWRLKHGIQSNYLLR